MTMQVSVFRCENIKHTKNVGRESNFRTEGILQGIVCGAALVYRALGKQLFTIENLESLSIVLAEDLVLCII